MVVAATVAYALSLVDLIPDFIPVLGHVDDLLLVPLGIWIAIRLIPAPIWRDCQAQASRAAAEPRSDRRAAVVVVLVWIVTAIWLGSWLWRRFAA